MFTGLIEEVGVIDSVRKNGQSARLRVKCSRVTEGTRVGDSIAVNGVCLTATSVSSDGFEADVMEETVRRSSLAALTSGSHVNLERAMPADGRFGGHIVAGHVDGTGRIRSIIKEEMAVVYEIEVDGSSGTSGAESSGSLSGTGSAAALSGAGIAGSLSGSGSSNSGSLLRYIVEKGSIAIDGISLTVASVSDSAFTVSIIPHTIQETTLSEKKEGDIVNLETDIIGKYVEKLMMGEKNTTGPLSGSYDEAREFLMKNGY